MDFNEKFKGQTQSIILFLLLDYDRHTDELKEIIDNKFNEVKIGTLYSIIARLKTQGLISEYRASSSDGSRRKYYKITPQGKELYNTEYKNLFIGIEIENNNAAPEESQADLNPAIEEEKPVIENNAPYQLEEPKEPENTSAYSKYVKKVEQYKQLEIDFSSLSIETDTFDEELEDVKEVIADKKPAVVQENKAQEPKINNVIIKEESKPIDDGIDYDNIHTSKFEYRNVLNTLFPTKNEEKIEIVDEFDDVSQSATEIAPISNTNVTNYNTIFEISEQENIKIRSSVDTNRYQGSKILSNKLRFHASIVISMLAFLEYFLTLIILGNSIKFELDKLIVISILFGSLMAITGFIYIFKSNHAVKDLPKFINSLEITLIITIAIIIISVCISSINGIDLYNLTELFNGIIFPSLIAINCPIYIAIIHFMSKLESYQSI